MKRTSIFLMMILLLPFCLRAQYSAVNQQLALSGAGYISVPNSTGLNYFGRMTIDAWVYPTQSGNNMAVVGNDVTTGYWFGLSAQGKLRFRANPSAVFESNGGVSLNTWTHIAVSFDQESAAIRFFINGNLDRLINAQQTWLGWSYNDLRIGADRSGNNPADYWRGRLDEVRIWKYVINFASASGDLYKIPHAVEGGLYGQHLVAAWRLNGDASDHLGAHNGSLVGSGTWVIDPDPPMYPRIGVWFRNGGVGTNASDYLSIPYYNGLALNGNYTIECWVKPSSTGGHNTLQTFVSRSTGVVAIFYPVWFGLNKSNDRLRFIPNGDAQNALESSSAVPEGQWSHVAARFAGSGSSYTATLFINGLPAGQKSYTSPGAQAQVPLVLGSTTTSLDIQTIYGYNGILDELRLWSLARSDAEIADNYRREFAGPLTGLVGDYRFDGDVLDASGGNRHGNNQYGYSDWYFYRTTDLPAEPSLKLVTPTGGEDWVIGTNASIRWSADGLHFVTVELSRDGGASWPEVLLNAGNAAMGTLNWPVVGPATTDARIRVRTPTVTPLEDVSGAVGIQEPPPVLAVSPPSITMTISRGAPLPPRIPVTIRNVGGSLLNWTASHGGAAWLDVSPVQGTANEDTAYVGLTTTDIPESKYAEIITIGGNAVNRGLQIPVTLYVTAKKVYGVSGFVRDTLGGGIPDIPVQATGETDREVRSGPDGAYDLADLPSGDYTVAPNSFYYNSTPAERSYTPLNNFEPGAHFTLRPSWGTMQFSYMEGWNLISLPLIPDQPDVAQYLPDAIMPAFAWDPDSGYVRRYQLDPFTAYWIKFAKSGAVALRGRFQRDLLLQFAQGTAGWHMIGMPSGACAVSGILQDPTGMLLSTYEYDPVYGYLYPADGVMVPGKGFFVKLGASGELLIRGMEEEHSSSARSMLRYPSARRE